MTNTAMNTEFLLYLGFNPRSLEFLKMGIKKIQPLPEKEKPKSGIEGINWCKRERKWVVYITIDGVRHWCGQDAELDEAVKLQGRKRKQLSLAL